MRVICEATLVEVTSNGTSATMFWFAYAFPSAYRSPYR